MKKGGKKLVLAEEISLALFHLFMPLPSFVSQGSLW